MRIIALVLSRPTIERILDIDEGARYLGEFSFGLNPCIESPIGMSFRVAVGNSYPTADYANHSALHWDLIDNQIPEYGGGEVWFDGTLVRKDGRFVLPELAGLDPDNLK